jgi:hypothetical protein
VGCGTQVTSDTCFVDGAPFPSCTDECIKSMADLGDNGCGGVYHSNTVVPFAEMAELCQCSQVAANDVLDACGLSAIEGMLPSDLLGIARCPSACKEALDNILVTPPTVPSSTTTIVTHPIKHYSTTSAAHCLQELCGGKLICDMIVYVSVAGKWMWGSS